MKNTVLEDFKNSLLAKEVHRTERSDEFSTYIESAEYYIHLRKKNDRETADLFWRTDNDVFGFSYPSIQDAFEIIARRIIYLENLILVIEELTKKEYQIRIALVSENEDYKNVFENRIKTGKTILKKLRPYVLEYAESFSEERKSKDKTKDISKFYKGWYI